MERRIATSPGESQMGPPLLVGLVAVALALRALDPGAKAAVGLGIGQDLQVEGEGEDDRGLHPGQLGREDLRGAAPGP
jgi:hypothetical protein